MRGFQEDGKESRFLRLEAVKRLTTEISISTPVLLIWATKVCTNHHFTYHPTLYWNWHGDLLLRVHSIKSRWMRLSVYITDLTWYYPFGNQAISTSTPTILYNWPSQLQSIAPVSVWTQNSTPTQSFFGHVCPTLSDPFQKRNDWIPYGWKPPYVD